MSIRGSRMAMRYSLGDDDDDVDNDNDVDENHDDPLMISIPQVRFAHTVEGTAYLYTMKLYLVDARRRCKHKVYVKMLVTESNAFVMPISQFVSSYWVPRIGLMEIMFDYRPCINVNPLPSIHCRLAMSGIISGTKRSSI